MHILLVVNMVLHQQCPQGNIPVQWPHQVVHTPVNMVHPLQQHHLGNTLGSITHIGWHHHIINQSHNMWMPMANPFTPVRPANITPHRMGQPHQ